MMEFIKFVLKKVSCYSPSTILRLEFESLVFGGLSLIPTTFGVMLRGFASKLLFKEITGFPWIAPRVAIVHAERIVSGSKLGINSGSYINGVGGIKFGSNVLIGSNVTISSGQHPIEGALPPVFERISIPKPIIINDDVWIGAGAVIMPGINLGKGSVIGANAVVTRSTEEYSVNVGAPARKINDRRYMTVKPGTPQVEVE